MGDDVKIRRHPQRSLRHHGSHGQYDTDSTQSTTNNSSPNLPEEVIVEILLRVPLRSLLQLKCVCKLWKTLISDPQFAKRHLLLLNSTVCPGLVSRDESGRERTIVSYNVESLLEDHLDRIEPDFYAMSYDYSNLGTCNGLLCLLEYSQKVVILWNPFLNSKSEASPTLVSPYGKNDIHSFYGFGYDQVNLRYKVLIACINIDDSTQIVTRIYCSGENSWRTIQNFPDNIDCFPYCGRRVGKCVNGTLNWVVKKFGFNSTQEMIVSFDLEKETYGEVLLPQPVDADNVSNVMLEVLSNCLCLCFESEKTQLVVWLMKEYGVVESWIKFMIIPHFIVTHMLPLFRSDPFYYYPIYGVSSTNGVVRQRNLTMMPSFVDPLFTSGNDTVLVKTMRSRLFLYHARKGTPYSRKLVRCSLFDDLQIYHESLVSPRW